MDNVREIIDWDKVSPTHRKNLINKLKSATFTLINKDRVARIPIEDEVDKTLEEFIESEVIETGNDDQFCIAEKIFQRFKEWLNLKTSADVCTGSIVASIETLSRDQDFYYRLKRRGFIDTKKGRPPNVVKFIGIKLYEPPYIPN